MSKIIKILSKNSLMNKAVQKLSISDSAKTLFKFIIFALSCFHWIGCA